MMDNHLKTMNNIWERSCTRMDRHWSKMEELVEQHNKNMERIAERQNEILERRLELDKPKDMKQLIVDGEVVSAAQKQLK